MSVFDWTRMVLVEFLVPIAWPSVALYVSWLLRAELRAVVHKVAESVGKLGDRITRAKFGPAEIEAHFQQLPAPDVIITPLKPPNS